MSGKRHLGTAGRAAGGGWEEGEERNGWKGVKDRVRYVLQS